MWQRSGHTEANCSGLVKTKVGYCDALVIPIPNMQDVFYFIFLFEHFYWYVVVCGKGKGKVGKISHANQCQLEHSLMSVYLILIRSFIRFSHSVWDNTPSNFAASLAIHMSFRVSFIRSSSSLRFLAISCCLFSSANRSASILL